LSRQVAKATCPYFGHDEVFGTIILFSEHQEKVQEHFLQLSRVILLPGGLDPTVVHGLVKIFDDFCFVNKETIAL
jgi:hypothetical protein